LLHFRLQNCKLFAMLCHAVCELFIIGKFRHLILGGLEPIAEFIKVILCFLIAPRWAKALEGLDPRRTRNVMFGMCAVTFLAGHLHYVFNAWEFVVARAESGDLSPLLYKGLHAPGAVLGLVLSGCVAARWSGISIGKFGDALAPTVGIGIAVARIGCFLEGCCYGEPCSWPWCVSFPSGSFALNRHQFMRLVPLDATASAPVHPLQLYFAAVGLLMTATALWMHKHKRYDGQVALVCVLLFSASSAALEGLRAPFGLRAYWGDLPQLTWVLMGMAAVCFVALIIGELRRRPTSSQTVASPS
jgi:phosphatidylglycerol:prolipoprotein diacylglycerol transferase